MSKPTLLAGIAILALSGCGQSGSSDPFVGFGPNPPLAAPRQGKLPQIAIAKVVGWAAGEAPKAPEGFVVTRLAEGLDHPRWLYVLPNGDVLVAESSSEAGKPKGLRGFAASIIMKNAGAATKSPNKIMLLRDTDGDGIAETKTLFAQGIKRPFGMALVGQTLYVAADNAIVSFPYADGQTSAGKAEKVTTKVADLAPKNGHITRNIAFAPDGGLYLALGSRERTLRLAVGSFLLAAATLYGAKELVHLLRG